MEKIAVDSNLNIAEEIATFLLFLLNEDREFLPKLSLKQILAAKARPGLSSSVLASSIISRFPDIGIPNGPLVGGATNVMENFVTVLCEEIIDSIQNDMRVDIALDPGATVTAAGGNAGGPVTVVGSTVAPHSGVGVAS